MSRARIVLFAQTYCSAHLPSATCLSALVTVLLASPVLTLCPCCQTPALFVLWNRRCVCLWLLLSLSCWRCVAFHVKRPRSSAGKQRCQLSFHPVFVTHLPALFQSLPQPSHTVPPWTGRPLSLTPATCHWKESITLSAHSHRAVKRPVRVIEPSESRVGPKENPPIGT